jgi:hypothetical protein
MEPPPEPLFMLNKILRTNLQEFRPGFSTCQLSYFSGLYKLVKKHVKVFCRFPDAGCGCSLAVWDCCSLLLIYHLPLDACVDAAAKCAFWGQARCGELLSVEKWLRLISNSIILPYSTLLAPHWVMLAPSSSYENGTNKR